MIAGLVAFAEPREEQTLDDDLCPLEESQVEHRATLLLDLQKPPEVARALIPGTLMRDVSLDLRANTELRVYALTSDPLAPRKLLGRTCKPYDNLDLQVRTAKDQSGTDRDCDDLPAQLRASTRAAASAFCARRDALQDRIETVAQARSDLPLAGNYLIEAIEDSKLELDRHAGTRSGTRKLLLISDLMQHASWYSHFELEWPDWSFERYLAIRKGQNETLGEPPAVRDLDVTVYYAPAENLLAHPRAARAHEEFWRDYFADADLSINARPPLPAYAAAPFADAPSNARQWDLARWERIQRERVRIDRLSAELDRAERALADEIGKLTE